MPRYRPGASRSTVSSRTGAVSENSVVFSSAGGHSHDGSNSSLIDTTKYSVWDFPVNTVYSTNPRASRQAGHIEQFKSFIADFVNTSVLEPAGVVLGNNVINANNIVAGSISSELIAANTIVAGNIAANTITTDLLAADAIQSDNYSYTSGNFTNAGSFFNLSDGSIRTDSFYLDGAGNMYIAGDVIIGSTAASTIESGAAGGATSLQPGDAASDVNTFNTTISGDKIRTGQIQSQGFVRGTGTFSTTGTRFDLNTGEIVGEQFVIDSSGSATFAGSLSAATGSLASFNITSSGLTTNGTASGTIPGGDDSSYSTTGYITIQNYGDIFIGSSPTSGSYAGQHHKTNLVGEYLNIRPTTSNTYITNTGVYAHFGKSSALPETNYMVITLEVEPDAYSNNLHNHTRITSSDVQSEIEARWSDSSNDYRVKMNADDNSSDLLLYKDNVITFHATNNDPSGGYLQIGTNPGDYFRVRANGFITGTDPVVDGTITANQGIYFNSTRKASALVYFNSDRVYDSRIAGSGSTPLPLSGSRFINLGSAYNDAVAVFVSVTVVPVSGSTGGYFEILPSSGSLTGSTANWHSTYEANGGKWVPLNALRQFKVYSSASCNFILDITAVSY